ncbi:F-box/LRR-repeat protein 4 isoform X2 [Amborella trichopoda]|uniref:F-box/LRR-repeat protein 4 isoform X2 n=1 Tax=Amborella trichopoda TaxID=13333 RepID=UPI0009BFBAB0|nr:F-box/LRR-repeat protein 4 isoform X2 [Amborella trichopoda]|eukprot:XP_020529113.1 F-box/LRR-repeat protein 4 isoform X2 [Amborella trichopoda]
MSSPSPIASSPTIPVFIKLYPLLESLSLRNCASVSSKAVCQVLKSCKELKLLDLGGSYCLNARAIQEVEGMCPKLVGLNYGGHINLEMGQAIGKSFPNLKWLNLRGSGIDRYGLQSILESCKGLEYLNVMGCPRLTLSSTLTNKVAGLLEFKCSHFSYFYNHDHGNDYNHDHAYGYNHDHGYDHFGYDLWYP